nr:hypothetical protein [Tanacetum cinerariifolium]
MSRDVLTVGSTMRIPLLYRGEYSQCVERFMNYLEEQTDGKAMINSIKNGDQQLPRVTQVSIARTSSTEQPPLEDKSMWSDQEKRIKKIDRLARSLLIQGLLNDIYSQKKMSRDVLTVGSTMRIPLLYRGEYSQWVERFMNYLEEQTDGKAMINSIKNGNQPLPSITQVSIAGTSSTEQPPLKDKSMWHMLGSEYGEQDRKAAVLYEYETFKATKGELLLDTYIRYLQKQYATMMRQIKNLMDINIDALYNILKQNQRDGNDAMGSKKKTVVVTSDPLALIAEKTNVSRSKEKVVVSSDSEGSEANDFSELKKITALLAKDFNRKKFYSKPTNNNLRTSSTSQSANKKQEKDISQKINANMVFMAQIEKVLSDSDASSSSVDEKISESLNVCENKLHKMGQTNQTVHIVMPLKDNLYNGQKRIGFEKLSYFEKAKDLRPTLYDEKVIGLGYTPMFLTHSNEALEIEKFKRSRNNKIEFAYDYGNLNASYVNERINFEDDYFQEIINPDFKKIDFLFQQTSSLKPYASNVILENIIIDLEDEVVNLLEK